MTNQLPLEFTVTGEPKGKQIRVRVFGKAGSIYTAKTSRAYIKTIQDAATELVHSGVWRPLAEDVPCKVEIYAYFNVPKSLSRPKKAAQIGRYVMKKPDPDNIEKCVYDALVHAGIIHDDKQIAIAGETVKLWCDIGEERTTIRVTQLPERPEENPWP